MSLKDHLSQLFDVYALRRGVHGPGYKPESISDRLRNRVVMLYIDVVSGKLPKRGWAENHADQFWVEIHQALRHAYGAPSLSGKPMNSTGEDALNFAINISTAEDLFTFIETSFALDCAWRALGDENDLVEALNAIFRLEASPYQLSKGVWREDSGSVGRRTLTRVSFPKVVRVDEEVAHQEAVLPALSALSDPAYAGADDEFRRALDDYRKGDFKDCLAKCGSAFESVLKVLCQKNGIACDLHKDTAGPLLDRLLAKSTLDTATFKESLFAVARMRNRLSSSHGGGGTVKNVERHVAQFAITATGGAIVLLVQDMGK